jgi:nucleotide-binding universal stress UspA family protein
MRAQASDGEHEGMNEPGPILLAVDHTSACAAATRSAVQLAQETGRPLWVVARWWVGPRTFGALPTSDLRRLGAEREAAARVLLAEARAEALAAGLEVHTRLLEGPSGDAVAWVAKEIGAWMVVTGKPERTRAERLLASDVGRRVARLAPCQVLAVDSSGERTLLVPA